MVQIEEGKYYRTRDGRKVGPAFVTGRIATFGNPSNHPSAVFVEGGYQSALGVPRENDIVALWDDSPARTVTRKEIVPGVYGVVLVNERGDGSGLESIYTAPTLNPTELRAAAATFIELADALEEV